jgi:hypothetical protein
MCVEVEVHNSSMRSMRSERGGFISRLVCVRYSGPDNRVIVRGIGCSFSFAQPRVCELGLHTALLNVCCTSDCAVFDGCFSRADRRRRH